MSLREISLSAFFAAILSVSALISIPFGSISFTLQSFVVMVMGLLLPRKIAMASILTYLFLGIIGLPVFSSGRAGLMVLFGPTGGYLFGFVLALHVMTSASFKGFFDKLLVTILAGIWVVYAAGIVGLILTLHIGFKDAISIGVIPFFVFDLIKAYLAVLLSEKLGDKLKQSIANTLTRK